MLRSSIFAALLCAITLSVQAAPPAPASSNDARIAYPACLVSLMKRCDIIVPAEEAGVLESLEAHEGMNVEAGAVLGQIRDSQVQMKKKVAVAEHEVAKAEAENDVDIRFNKAKSGVAEKEYKLNRLANEKADKARPLIEMEKLFLQWQQAWLGIEQAQFKQSTNKLTADARQADVEAADDDIQRRKVVARQSGEVIEIYAAVGEWLSPGQKVLRLAQMDKLWVDGPLDIKEFGYNQIAGRPVRVIAQVGPGRVEEFQGKVVYADPRVVQGQYNVRAEIVNRRDGGDGPWLLHPGMQPQEMIISALPAAAGKQAPQTARMPQ